MQALEKILKVEGCLQNVCYKHTSGACRTSAISIPLEPAERLLWACYGHALGLAERLLWACYGHALGLAERLLWACYGHALGLAERLLWACYGHALGLTSSKSTDSL